MTEDRTYTFGDATAVRLLEKLGVDPKGVTKLSIHFEPRGLARIQVEKVATDAYLAAIEEAAQTFEVKE